jgi:hypothetical protein
MEGLSSKLEQGKDTVSELEDKLEIKGQKEEILVKQLKTCDKNIQELTAPYKDQT